MEGDKKKKSPRKSSEKESVSPTSSTSPIKSPTKRLPLTTRDVSRLSQERKSPERKSVSPKRKLEKENSPVKSPTGKSGSQPSFMTPKKLKFGTADTASDSEKSQGTPRQLKKRSTSRTPEKSEGTSSKQSKMEDRPLIPEKSEGTSSQQSKMEDRPPTSENDEETASILTDSQAEESDVDNIAPLRPNQIDPRHVLAERAKRNAYLKGLDYGLIPEKTFNKLNNIWFDYSMPDDIKKYYDCMKKDSEKKTKDCERCNKDMYEKLVKLYKLEPEENILAQGYIRRDFASCPYPLQSSCDCLVACIKCDVLYSNERDYEGNTAPGLIKDPFLEWQGVFDRTSSDKDLPDLLNPDGTVYKEDEDRGEQLKKQMPRYMIREKYREHEFLLTNVRKTTVEERLKKYETDLEGIVKETLIDYRFNLNNWPCRYGHIACNYSSDRNRTILGFRFIPKYMSKEENPNLNKKLKGKWEPY